MKLPREFSLAEVAMLAGGKFEGPADTKISAVSPNPLTAKEGDLALVFDPKFLNKLDNCQASIVIVPEGTHTKVPRVEVKRPLLVLQRLLSALQPRRYFFEGVHPSAVVDPSAELAVDVSVGANAVIGPGCKIGAGTKIGPGCLIGANVIIGERCLLHQGSLVGDQVKIGNRVILQQGASIGGDGFGYVTERPSNLELRMAGKHDLSEDPNPLLKIPQIGTVVLEDDVEIGSLSTVDRATMGATVIGSGTKIDNLTMIAHNCRLGREVIVVAQSGLAGSVTVGDRAVISGHVAVKDHLSIGKDAIIEGKAGVMNDIAEKDVVVGVPAMPARDHFKMLAHMRKAPQVHNELKELKRRVAELEKMLTAPDPGAGGRNGSH